jgi:cyclase
MKAKFVFGSLLVTLCWLFAGQSLAQDLGPHFKKIKDGIFVYAGALNEANSTIILTQEGVVMIDTGQSPKDSHIVMAGVKKLTSQPVRFIIHTEPHPDHVMGDFVFSPPAIVIGHAGSVASMKASDSFSPARIEKQMSASPEMRSAFKEFRLITPHIEYRDKLSLNVGERAFELYYLKNVHSEADTAIWLPKERVLFTAASVGVKRFGNHRPLVSIPDTLSAIKMMKALNPEVVIPGHGVPGTAKILDDMESYYSKLMDGVRQMVNQGKSLDEIKKELKIPGTEDWEGKDRFPNNIEAAYRAVKGS